MSEYVARELNDINPHYCARPATVKVKVNPDSEYYYANIKMKSAEVDSSDEQEEKQDNEQKEKRNIISIEDVIGNHAVVLMQVPGKNITLMVDPTNPGLGVLQNGKITLFNTNQEKPVIEEIKPVGQIIFGIKGELEVIANYVSSINFEDFDSLNEEYGLDAQNKALEEALQIRASMEMEKQNPNYRYDEKNIDDVQQTNKSKQEEQKNQNYDDYER